MYEDTVGMTQQATVGERVTSADLGIFSFSSL